MTDYKCQAVIPSSCRFHGLGKNLPDDVYTVMNNKVADALEQSAPYKRSRAKNNDGLFNYFQNGYAEMLWKGYIKDYNYTAKLEKTRDKILKPKLASTASDEVYNKAVHTYNVSKDIDFYTYKSELIPFKAIFLPLRAKNNCSQVSRLIVEKFDKKDLASDTELKIIRMDAPDSKKPKMFWHHAAVEVERDGQKFVVDYTIHQFDKTIPIPYVDTIENWTEKLNSITGEQWTNEHLDPWHIKGGETRNSFFVK
jgi:hypothetical protein